MTINLMDARRGLHNKCLELFTDKRIAEQIYRYLCDGIEECEEVGTVKHGRWIVNKETEEWVTIYCDQCHDGMWNRKGDPYPKYCFNCGARMDAQEVEE